MLNLPATGISVFYLVTPPDSNDAPIEVAELGVGEALVVLGGWFHGAGTNATLYEETPVYGFSTPHCPPTFEGFATVPLRSWVFRPAYVSRRKKSSTR